MRFKDLIIAAMRSVPVMSVPLWRRLYPLFRKDERWIGNEYGTDRIETFSTIFAENRWGDSESVSGNGSTRTSTALVERSLRKAIARTGAKSLLDAPCGDFNWMRHVDLPIDYIGGEIVPDLARGLQERFGDARHRFITLDIVADPLPPVDLWLCRHVLMHLSHRDILATLDNFARSNIGHILVDNYTFERQNRDIRTGGYRYVNLRRAPFELPAPLAEYPNSLPPSAPDHLSLWSREQVAAALATRPGRSSALAAAPT